MRCNHAAIAATFLTAACSAPLGDSYQPHPTGVVPDSAPSVDPVQVVIQGTGFLASAKQSSGGGTPALDTTQRAWLGEVELQAVTWVDPQTVQAVVPAGLAPGQYDLTVQNALGERGSLDAAYTVLPAAGLVGALSADSSTVNVGQLLTFTLTLTNSGGSAVTNIVLATPVVATTDGGGARPAGSDPTPPGSLAPGEQQKLAWTFEPISAGHISISVSATGVDSASGEAVSATIAASAPVLIVQPAAATLSATTWSAVPAVQTVNEPIAVTLTLANTGDADVADVAGVAPVVSPVANVSCTQAAIAGNATFPVEIAPLTSRTFNWTCTATSVGTYDLGATVAATDGTGGSSIALTLPALAVTLIPPATPPPPVLVPPPAPTGVTATAVSQTRIDLSWNAVTAATGYGVLRGTKSGGPYVPVGTSVAPSFSDTAGLSPGTTYYYVVQATNAAGASASSAQASATTLAPAPTPPPAPTGLTAEASSHQRIDLSWHAVTGATGYIVFRGTRSGGPYAQIATPAATSFTDTGLSAGTTYYYVVQATNAAGNSPNSNQAAATARK